MTVLRSVLLATTLVTAVLASQLASAQTTYRWIDKATGQTVYSDQPPPPGVKVIVSSKPGEEGGNETQLPYATRVVVQKYPVTLYTAANCVDICKLARDLLNGRGVPFAEKMINTDEEVAELSKRLGSQASIPSFFVGSQSFRGFEPAAWNNLLDLAGYPNTAPYGSKPSGTFAK